MYVLINNNKLICMISLNYCICGMKQISCQQHYEIVRFKLSLICNI